MENYEEKILKEIDRDVSSNAGLVQSLVEGETKSLRDDQIAFYKEALKKETDTYLEKELSDLRLYAATKSSRDKMNTKKKLLSLRQSLADKLFADVRSDLMAFVKTDGYKAYLSHHLAKIYVTEKGYFIRHKTSIVIIEIRIKKSFSVKEVAQ